MKVTQRRACVMGPAELPSKERQLEILLLGECNLLLIPGELACARCKLDDEAP